MKNPVATLRKTALLEGLSYLVLLGIAMPLKYIWDMPLAVQITGWIHGALFVALCALLLAVLLKGWPFYRAALVFIASLLPFGPFLLDRRMVQYEREYEAKHAPPAVAQC